MSRFVDLSVTVDENTFSPPSTNMKLEVTPHRRGPGFWQVSSVNQSLHTGAHIDSPLHVFKNGITTAEITLDQVMGEALVVDLSFVGANHEITVDDLKKGGAGDVKRGDIVLLKTGWTDSMYGRWPDYFTRSRCRAGAWSSRPPSTRSPAPREPPRDSSRRYDRSRRGAAADRAAHPILRQPDRGERGEPHGAQGRAALDHRAQRGGQDHLLPTGLGRDGAVLRARAVPGERHHRAAAASSVPARHRQVLPDHQHLPAPLGARERAGRGAGLRALVQLLVARRPDRGLPRARGRDPRHREPGSAGGAPRRAPLPRRDAASRDRHLAGLRPRAALAGRAHRGHEPRGDRRDHGADQRAGPRAHRGAGGAQDEAGHGDLGPGHRAATGRGACRRHPRGDPREPARAGDVPRGVAMSLLSLEDVHTYYGEAHILQGVSLSVGDGEVVTMIGRNGAGKTTTLLSIMGIARARRGAVRMGGQDITNLETHEIVRRGIGWVPEERRVLPNLTVLDNLRLGTMA